MECCCQNENIIWDSNEQKFYCKVCGTIINYYNNLK